jgi:NAD(P)H-hydrate repair Nnr-like enzyme with NAD(P)H-hydrate dehydratase domain
MHIKQLVHQFEELMSAAAFAEAGETDTAVRLCHGRRKVLLVLTGEETDMKAARYAINTSRRIGAGIEILYLAQNSSEQSRLEAYLQELTIKGIEYQVTQCKQSLKEEVMKFIKKEKDIQFVVIDSEDLGVCTAKSHKASLDDWESLGCPIVLVSGLAQA